MIKRRIITLMTLAVFSLGMVFNALAQDEIHPNLSPVVPIITSSKLKRSPTGVIKLIITGFNFREGSTVTIGGETPKKFLYKDPLNGAEFFQKVVAKGGVCKGLPGAILMAYPDGTRA